MTELESQVICVAIFVNLDYVRASKMLVLPLVRRRSLGNSKIPQGRLRPRLFMEEEPHDEDCMYLLDEE